MVMGETSQWLQTVTERSIPIETNFVGFYTELSNTLHSSASLLRDTQGNFRISLGEDGDGIFHRKYRMTIYLMDEGGLTYMPVVEEEESETASEKHGSAANIKQIYSLLSDKTKYGDSLGGSDILRSHKAGEIACFGDEGENVRVHDGFVVKPEAEKPDTEKQREFPSEWSRTTDEFCRFCYDVDDESNDNDVKDTVGKNNVASTYGSSPSAIVVCEDGNESVMN